MSRRLLFTDAARWQLLAAIESIHRAEEPAARKFREDVEALVRDRGALEQRGAPLPEFPELPFREVRIHGYRIFFRRESDSTWIAGVWKEHKGSTA